MAGGAEPGRVDAIGGHSCRCQLIARGRPPVEEPAIRSRRSIPNSRNRWIVGHFGPAITEPPRQQRLAEARRGELLANIRTDFVTTGTNTRPESDDEVARTRSALSHERLDGHLRRARGETPPSRMHRCHHSRATVRNEHRHAVGDLHGPAGAGLADDEDVALGRGLQRASRSHDRCAVHLPQARQLPWSHVDGLCYGQPGIVGVLTPIARPKAPQRRREDVPRVSLERWAHERRSTVALPPDERRGGQRQYHRFIMPEIIGLGLDSTDIDRVEEVIERWGDRFMTRVFTSGEIAYCQRRHRPAIHFAGRFAAKEAAMKALGTGHTQNVLWRDVEVVRHGGPPTLVLHGGARRRFDAIGGGRTLLTITHSETVALAQVLLIGR